MGSKLIIDTTGWKTKMETTVETVKTDALAETITQHLAKYEYISVEIERRHRSAIKIKVGQIETGSGPLFADLDSALLYIRSNCSVENWGEWECNRTYQHPANLSYTEAWALRKDCVVQAGYLYTKTDARRFMERLKKMGPDSLVVWDRAAFEHNVRSWLGAFAKQFTKISSVTPWPDQVYGHNTTLYSFDPAAALLPVEPDRDISVVSRRKVGMPVKVDGTLKFNFKDSVQSWIAGASGLNVFTHRTRWTLKLVLNSLLKKSILNASRNSPLTYGKWMKASGCHYSPNVRTYSSHGYRYTFRKPWRDAAVGFLRSELSNDVKKFLPPAKSDKPRHNQFRCQRLLVLCYALEIWIRVRKGAQYPDGNLKKLVYLILKCNKISMPSLRKVFPPRRQPQKDSLHVKPEPQITDLGSAHSGHRPARGH